MHSDTLTVSPKTFLQNDLQISLSGLLSAGYLLQCFAIFTPPKQREPFRYARYCIDCYYAALRENADRIRPAYGYRSLLQNRKDGVISALLTVENARAAQGEISNLAYLFSCGVRMFSLGWNGQNELCGERITPLGAEFLRYAETLPLMVDCSHLSDGAFYDLVAVYKKPFCASHSNARAVTPVLRNLTDDQIKIIADRGGVIGLNFYSLFTGGGDTVENLLTHARHIVRTGGEDVLALGSDYDGIPAPKGLETCAKLPVLYEATVKEFGASRAEKIFSRNFLRFFQSVCP